MKRSVLIALLVLIFGNLSAQNPQSAPNKDKQEKKFTWGFDERIRLKFTDNMLDTNTDKDDEMNYMRFRSRFWAGYNFGHGVSLNGRLTNEFRPYFHPDRDFTPHELVFDQMYLEMKGTITPKLNLRIGRQDMLFGEGFVMLDGNPLDGSRTIYFNAVRATVDIPKGTFDAFVIANPSKDRFLPVLHDPDITHQGLIEQQERAAGVYLTRQLTKTARGEFYHITKREQAQARLLFPGSTIHTTGTRFSGSASTLFRYAGELALQSGEYGKNDRSGVGGYIDIRRDLPFYPAASVMVNYTHLSGDDPSTANNEGWDPVFSRWPKWSELYIYTQAPEFGRPAYWSNMKMLSAGFNVKLNPTTDLDFAYRYMKAIKCGPTRPIINPAGRSRGDLWISRVNFKINKYLSGHFLTEILKPGDYYLTNRDLTYFIRTELVFRR